MKIVENESYQKTISLVNSNCVSVVKTTKKESESELGKEIFGEIISFLKECETPWISEEIIFRNVFAKINRNHKDIHLNLICSSFKSMKKQLKNYKRKNNS